MSMSKALLQEKMYEFVKENPGSTISDITDFLIDLPTNREKNRLRKVPTKKSIGVRLSQDKRFKNDGFVPKRYSVIINP